MRNQKHSISLGFNNLIANSIDLWPSCRYAQIMALTLIASSVERNAAPSSTSRSGFLHDAKQSDRPVNQLSEVRLSHLTTLYHGCCKKDGSYSFNLDLVLLSPIFF